MLCATTFLTFGRSALHSVEELRIMIDKAYTGFGHCGDSTSVAPVVHLEDNQYMLELFHGPTASFKDLALQLTPKLFARAAEEADGLTYLILVATSGDTGSAALHGFGVTASIVMLVAAS